MPATNEFSILEMDYLKFHLKEALEELTTLVNAIDNDPSFDEVDLRISMEHLYNHVNTAWNARHTPNGEGAPLSRETFYRLRQFPQDIDMGSP